MIDQVVLLPVIMPLLGAGLCLVLGRSAAAQRLVSVIVLALEHLQRDPAPDRLLLLS